MCSRYVKKNFTHHAKTSVLMIPILMTSLGSRCHSTSSHLNKNNIANILPSVVQQIRAQLESQPGSHWLPDALFCQHKDPSKKSRLTLSPTCIITHHILPFLGSLRWLLLCTDGLWHSLLEPAQTFVIARLLGCLGPDRGTTLQEFSSLSQEPLQV